MPRISDENYKKQLEVNLQVRSYKRFFILLLFVLIILQILKPIVHLRQKLKINYTLNYELFVTWQSKNFSQKYYFNTFAP